MVTKIIGAILLSVSAFLLSFVYNDIIEYFEHAPRKLQVAIQQDTASSLKINLETSRLRIHHVEIKYRSKVAFEFLNKFQPKFKTEKDGDVWLEMEVMDLPDEANPGVITQTSVFDLKSNNKISEFGQTYYFRNFKKLTKNKN